MDEDVEECINENTNKGSLVSRVLMKDEQLRNGSSFDLACKLMRTER